MQYVELPPHFFPPANDAQPIYGFGVATVTGPNTNWVVPAGVQTQIGAAQVAIIKKIGLAILNMLTSTVVTTILRYNFNPTAPVRQMPAAGQAFAERAWDSFAYVIPPRAFIDQIVTVVDAGTYTVTGYYEGYLMVRSVWDRYLAGLRR